MNTIINTGVCYVRNPELVATDMDGDTVMMSIENGEYYGLSGVGTRVWELLENPMTVQQIVASVCAEFDVVEATCQADMKQFLDELKSYGLISHAAKA